MKTYSKHHKHCLVPGQGLRYHNGKRIVNMVIREVIRDNKDNVIFSTWYKVAEVHVSQLAHSYGHAVQVSESKWVEAEIIHKHIDSKYMQCICLRGPLIENLMADGRMHFKMNPVEIE